MGKSRIWVGLVLVPALMLAERLTYFGVRAIFMLYAATPPSRGGLGTSMSDAGLALATLATTGVVATLVGGGAAIAVGSRRLLVLGAALYAVAYAALAFASPASLIPIAVVWGVARGLFLANLYAVAAEQLAEARPITLVALFASLTLAVNVGAFCGPLFAGLFRGISFTAGLFFDAAIMALAAGATTMVFLLDRASPPARPPTPRPALALLVLAAVGAPLFLIAELPGTSVEPTSMLQAILPMVVLAGSSLLVLATFIALAAGNSRISFLLCVSTGLLAAALGALIHLGAGPNAASAALSDLGAAIVEPLVLALIATGTPRRYAPAAFAAWITLRHGMSSLVTTESGVPPSWLVALGMIGCALAGIALVARGRSLEGTLFPALATPREGDPPVRTARVSKRTRAARVSKRTGTDRPPDPE